MAGFNIFLSAMCVLFAISAAVLLGVSAAQALRHQRQRAAIYLGLTMLAAVVAAGFYFFRRLM